MTGGSGSIATLLIILALIAHSQAWSFISKTRSFASETAKSQLPPPFQEPKNEEVCGRCALSTAFVPTMTTLRKHSEKKRSSLIANSILSSRIDSYNLDGLFLNRSPADWSGVLLACDCRDSFTKNPACQVEMSKTEGLQALCNSR